jgi:hypothetical protein
MDEAVASLLSRHAGAPQDGRRPEAGARFDWRVSEAMDNRGPVDKPFLVFVVIVAICIAALAYTIYPQHP